MIPASMSAFQNPLRQSRKRLCAYGHETRFARFYGRSSGGWLPSRTDSCFLDFLAEVNASLDFLELQIRRLLFPVRHMGIELVPILFPCSRSSIGHISQHPPREKLLVSPTPCNMLASMTVPVFRRNIHRFPRNKEASRGSLTCGLHTALGVTTRAVHVFRRQMVRGMWRW